MAVYVVSTSLVPCQDRWVGIEISFLSLAQCIGYWLFRGLTNISAHHLEWDKYMPNSPTKTLIEGYSKLLIIDSNAIHVLVCTIVHLKACAMTRNW